MYISSMNRMSKKGRIWLTIGCFVSSAAMVVACIILIRADSEMVSITTTGLSALAFFVMAFVFMPPKGYVPVREEKKEEPQQRQAKYKPYKEKKIKEPFISDDEWEELEEEEEEAEIIEDIFDND